MTLVKSEGKAVEMGDVLKIALGATVAALVGSLIAYFKSIGGKADKAAVEKLLKDQREEFEKQLHALKSDSEKQVQALKSEFEKQIDAISRRHSAWEQKTERFATREMLMEMKQDFQRLESRFETNFQKINDLLVTIAEKK